MKNESVFKAYSEYSPQVFRVDRCPEFLRTVQYLTRLSGIKNNSSILYGILLTTKTIFCYKKGVYTPKADSKR